MFIGFWAGAFWPELSHTGQVQGAHSVVHAVKESAWMLEVNVPL